MYHSFLICSSVYRHLLIGCFHVLATVNMGTYVFLNYDFSQCICPFAGLVDPFVSFIPSFLKDHCTVLPTNSTRGFPFLHVLACISL